MSQAVDQTFLRTYPFNPLESNPFLSFYSSFLQGRCTIQLVLRHRRLFLPKNIFRPFMRKKVYGHTCHLTVWAVRDTNCQRNTNANFVILDFFTNVTSMLQIIVYRTNK